MKYSILILVLILISCLQTNEKDNSKRTNNKGQKETSLESENNKKKVVDTLNQKPINITDTLKPNKEVEVLNKEEKSTNICTISGKIKFSHDLLGAPYMEGGNNGPSYSELVKKATSENYSYKIELYQNGKLQREIITNYKNHFHYKFKVNQNSLFKVKFYYKNSKESDYEEITSGNFMSAYLKTKTESNMKWNISRIFFTV